MDDTPQKEKFTKTKSNVKGKNNQKRKDINRKRDRQFKGNR